MDQLLKNVKVKEIKVRKELTKYNIRIPTCIGVIEPSFSEVIPAEMPETSHFLSAHVYRLT